MNTLKELLNKVYLDLQTSDRIEEYPELSEKKNIADTLEAIALNSLQDFISEDKLDAFTDESEKSFTESTFKKYISNYPEFLNNVESEFYNGLLLWLAG